MPTRVSVWPPLPPSAWVRRPARPLPFPLEEPGVRLYARARHGLFAGLRALGLVGGDEVLMPAYHHGSEVEAAIQAGLVPRFYDVEGPSPDPAGLEVGPRTRALYLTHTLGLPVAVAPWRAWCDERGLLLVEDAAQAWLAEDGGAPVGSLGDMAVFCLYKTVGVPDGAALVSVVPPAAPAGGAGSGLRGAVRRHGAWAIQRSRRLASLRARGREEAAYDPDEDHALGDPETPPSRATLRLLRGLARPEVAERRRENYRFLLSRLGELVPPAFADLPPGASPFAFPVRAADKDRLWRHLADAGIDALSFWTYPHRALPEGRFPGAEAMRTSLIGLPLHQELREADLERVARAVRTLKGAFR